MRGMAVGIGGLLVTSTLLAAGVASAAVGDFANPDHLEIRGAKSFSSDEIKESLYSHWDVVLAGHPHAELGPFIRALREQTIAGYRNLGFVSPYVAIDLVADKQRLVMTIDEGPRYTRGEIQVVDPAGIDVDRLKTRLTEKYPPQDATVVAIREHNGTQVVRWVDRDGEEVDMNDPVWEQGNPVSFADSTRESRQKTIKHALADLGYHFTTFSSWIEPNDPSKTADLVIKILDTGPTAAIGQIEITGNTKNSDQEILDYLDLAPGTPFDRESSVRIHRSLWRSARFIDFSVEPKLPTQPGDLLVVLIDVLEYPHAPPLAQPLSAEQTVLLKTRDWLANPQRWNGDLVFTAQVQGTSGNLECLISPTRGTCLSAARPKSSGPFEWAFTGSNKIAGVYSNMRQKKLEGTGFDNKITVNFGLTVQPEPDDAQRPYRQNIAFAAGVSSRDEGEPPFLLKMKIDPCFFLSIAHEHEAKCEIDNGVMTITKTDSVWKIDAETGRVIEMQMETVDDAWPGTVTASLRFEKGALSAKTRQLQTQTAQFINDFDEYHPLSSVLSFGCKEIDAWRLYGLDNKKLELIRLAGAAIDAGLLQKLDELFVNQDDDDIEEFDLPGTMDSLGDLASLDKLLSVEFVSRFAVIFADELFARDTWPYVFTREAGLVVTDETRYTGSVLEELYESPDTGPLCCLAVATSLENIQPQFAKAFAQRGIERLSTDYFHKDCKALLDDRGFVGQSVLHVANTLRRMDDQDINRLCDELSPKSADLLRRFVAGLQAHADKPIEEALQSTLDIVWLLGVKAQVRNTLNGLAQMDD